MDYQQTIMLGLGIACGVLGWFARELYAATQSLRKDLTALEIKLGTDYVRYDRLAESLKPILDSLSEIKQSLRDKVDKT